MPLFGGLKEENEKLRAELGRLAGITLPELAERSWPGAFTSPIFVGSTLYF